MLDRVKFFSIYDMSIPHYFERAEEVVSRYRSGWRASDVNDVIELYNIWLFVENGVSAKTWDDEVIEVIRGFKQDVISYFQCEQSSWPELYSKIVFEYRHFFWEIVDRFNIKCSLTVDGLRTAFVDRGRELSYVLSRQRLVSKYNRVIAEMLRDNEFAAEWLLSEFVEGREDGNKDRFYFPSSLSLEDREKIISDYLDQDEPNLNYVRLVLVAKKDANLRLSDEVI